MGAFVGRYGDRAAWWGERVEVGWGGGWAVAEFEVQEGDVDVGGPFAAEPALVDAGGDDVRVVGVDVCAPDGTARCYFLSTYSREVTWRDLHRECTVLGPVKVW